MRARDLLSPAAAAALAAALADPALAQGCALCRRNLEQNGGTGLLEGFYWSIVLLISLPILLVGTFAFLVWRARRRAREAYLAPMPGDQAAVSSG